MGNSIANVQYGTYIFDPVPQIGLRESMKRLGDSGNGPAKKECVITVVGTLEGETHNAVEAKVAALRAAVAKEGQTFLWNDGVTNRVNATVQPLSCDIPEDWAQYEAKYSLTFLWFPNDETYWAHDITPASYNGYTFSPIPVLGKEYAPYRESAEADRQGSKVTVTLQGFIDKGSYAANLAEYALLETACATDGTLAYGTLGDGTWTQACRFQRLTRPPDVGDAKMAYTVALEYDADTGASGIVRMASSRSILSEERDAIDYAPFWDDAGVQRVGRNGQRITATGYVVGTSLAAAKAAALVEINLQFPGTLNTDNYEPTREIREIADEKKVEWNVQRFYPTPAYSADTPGQELYGARAVFP